MKTFLPTDIITDDDVLMTWAEVNPNAFVIAGRPRYYTVDIPTLKEWLGYTKVDRYIWRQAEEEIKLSAGPEFVCVNYSILLLALLEQERLKRGLILPFAAGYCKVAPRQSANDHALLGVIGTDKLPHYVEPQNDDIMPATDERYELQALLGP